MPVGSANPVTLVARACRAVTSAESAFARVVCSVEMAVVWPFTEAVSAVSDEDSEESAVCLAVCSAVIAAPLADAAERAAAERGFRDGRY